MSTVIVVTEWQTGGMCRSKERFRFWAGGSMVVWNSNYTPQNYLQFKMYELHISGVFQLIFLGNNWGLTEHTEGDIWDQRGWPCLMIAFRWKKNTRRGHLKPKVIANGPSLPMWGSTSTTTTWEKDHRVQIQRWGQWWCWGHLCWSGSCQWGCWNPLCRSDFNFKASHF